MGRPFSNGEKYHSEVSGLPKYQYSFTPVHHESEVEYGK